MSQSTRRNSEVKNNAGSNPAPDTNSIVQHRIRLTSDGNKNEENRAAELHNVVARHGVKYRKLCPFIRGLARIKRNGVAVSAADL